MDKRCNIWPLFCSLMLMASVATYAQPKAEATLKPETILIGEPATLKLEVKHAADLEVFWTNFTDVIDIDSTRSVEILSVSDIDTIDQNGEYTQTRSYEVTAWDTGFYIIPPIAFSYKSSGTEALTSVNTYPVLLTVNTVAVDTTSGIKGIKDPLDMPFKISEIKNWLIGGGLVLLAIIGLIVFLVTRKPKQVEVFEAPAPKIPPHVLAAQRLNELKGKGLWEGGEEKAYHSELTDILRQYLEDRFGFYAMESTTDEILERAQRLTMSADQRENLGWIFKLSDLVKFAKVKAYPDEHKESLQRAFEFVERTKQERTEEA